MGVKKAKTANQIAYEKELRKLKNRVKTAEKAGYVFPENFIPPAPTRVYKKDIQQLSKLKGDILRRKAEFFVDTRTGEVFTGSEGVKIQHYRSNIKAKQTVHKKQVLQDYGEQKLSKSVNDYIKARTDQLSQGKSYKFWKEFEKLPIEIKDVIHEKWIEYQQTPESVREEQRKKDLLDEYGAEQFGYLSKEESKRMWERFFNLSEEEQSEIRDLFYDSLSEAQKTQLFNKLKREREAEKESEIEHEREFDRTVPESDSIDPWHDGVFTPSEVDNVLANIEEQLDRWTPKGEWNSRLSGVKETDKNVIQRMYDGALAEYGREALAEHLQGKSAEINALLGEILYASGDKEGNFKDGNTRVNFDINLFSSLLSNNPLSIHQSERLTDLVESMELNN